MRASSRGVAAGCGIPHSSRRTWREQKAKLDIGGAGDFKPADEAQAREQYFLFRAQVEAAKSDLFTAENRLRYIMGLAVSDGRLIRPADDPTMARATFQWHDVVGEALARESRI